MRVRFGKNESDGKEGYLLRETNMNLHLLRLNDNKFAVDQADMSSMSLLG